MSDISYKLPTWCVGDDWCPMIATSAIIGKKWHPVIIHRLLENGRLRFNELEDKIEGISGKVLSESLDDLEEKHILERNVHDTKPIHVEYKLTEYGKALEPMINEMQRWGKTYLKEAQDKKESVI